MTLERSQPAPNAGVHNKAGLGVSQIAMLILIAASMATFRSRDLTEIWGGGGFDTQVRFQLGLWVVFGLVAGAQILRRRADLRLLSAGPLHWYTMYVALALMSTVYSPAPLLTLYRAMQLAISVVLVVSVRRGLSFFYAAAAVYMVVNWLLVLAGVVGLTFGLSWIRGPWETAVFYAESEGSSWRFASAFGHPSQIASVAAPGAVGLLAHSPFRSVFWTRALVVLFVVSTVATVSRTAIAALLGGLIVALAGHRRMLPAALLALSLLGAISLVPWLRHDALRFLRRGQTTEELQTLSNRRNVYEAALQRGIRRFWTGEGFRAGRVRSLDDDVGETGAIHAHNAFLEAFMGLGIGGLVLVTMVLASLLARVLSLGCPERGDCDPRASPIRTSILAMLVPMTAFCVMDAGFASRVSPFTLMFLLLCAMTERFKRVSSSGGVDAELVPASDAGGSS